MSLRGSHASLCDQCSFDAIKASLEIVDLSLLCSEFAVLFGTEIAQGFDHEGGGGAFGDEARALGVARDPVGEDAFDFVGHEADLTTRKGDAP